MPADAVLPRGPAATSMRVSVKRALPRRAIYRRRHPDRLERHDGPRREPIARPRRHRLAARAVTTRRMRPVRPARRPGARRRPDEIAARPDDLSRPRRIAWRRSAAWATCCSSTIPRPPMPTPRRRRWPASPDIFWIAGGKPKTGGIGSLAEFFPRIRKAYLIGEAAAEFAATLEGKVPHVIAGTLDNARRSGRARRRGAGVASRWCCCRRPAPPSISSAISRCAATLPRSGAGDARYREP